MRSPARTSSTPRAAPFSMSMPRSRRSTRAASRGLGLDVLPVEPVPAGSLLGHPRVILTPHAAFFSVEAEHELRRKAAQNIVSWLQHRPAGLRRVAGTRRP